MPNLKTTVRKQTDPADAGTRVKCNYCGASFKRLQYMMKHMKRIHQGQTASTSSVRQEKEKEVPVSTPNPRQSDSESAGDWDIDPDIEVDLVPGCTVRKPTKPQPVSAPSKPQPVSTPTKAQTDAASIQPQPVGAPTKPKPASALTKPQPVGTTTKPKPESAPKKRKLEQPEQVAGVFNMRFSVDCKDGRTTRRVCVQQDGECSLESSGQGKGRMQIDLSEFVDIDKVSGVCFRVEGTELNVDVNYRQ